MADRLVVLRQGRVQQIGTPEQLHTRPSNWHVADFMGFRNILPMQVTAAGEGRMNDAADSVTVQGDGVRLDATAVQPVTAGEDVMVGIRPEDLTLGGPESAAGSSNTLRATVEVVEYQGRELAMEVLTERGLRLHVRSGTRATPGDAVTVLVDPARVLVFPSSADDQSPSDGLRAAPSVERPRAEALSRNGGAAT